MKVTEHNVDCDWKDSELEALMSLVMREIKREDNDTFTQLFYGKIYGKLMGMKHGVPVEELAQENPQNPLDSL